MFAEGGGNMWLDMLMFITRPFRSVIGWLLILAAVAWIWARVTGRVGSPAEAFGRNKGKGGGGSYKPDYIIK